MTIHHLNFPILLALVLPFPNATTFGKNDFEQSVKPILDVHCVKCHGPEKQKGKLRFDTLSTDFLKDRAAAETWHDASDQVKLGEMPPEEEEPLSSEDRKILTEWIDNNLSEAFKKMQGTESSLVMRRLNRAEYQNTMTDLLGFEMDYSDELPNDSLSPDGFLNNGASQVTSAVQIESYLKAARKALDFVLLEGGKPETSTSQVVWNKGKIRGPGNSRYLAYSSARLGRVNYWHGSFQEPPRDGRLTVRVKASTDRKPGQPAPILSGRYGYFVTGLTLNVMDDLGEIPITSIEPEYYEFSSHASFFPRAEPHVPLDKLNGVITFQNVLKDGHPPPPGENKEIVEEINAADTRKKLEKWEKERAQLLARRELFEREKLPGRFEKWLLDPAEKKTEEPVWSILGNAEPESLEGANFVAMKDGSFLLAGPNPKNDRWVVTAEVDLPVVRAIRIEALTDNSLKKKGPGRAGNGNFLLSDLRVFVKPKGVEGKGKPVKLVNPQASLKQGKEQFFAAASIDADKKMTGWSPNNQVGKDHACLFEFAEAVENENGTVFTVELDYMQKNAFHVIGRPRFSLSSMLAPPLDGSSERAEVIALVKVARQLGGIESLDKDELADLRKNYRLLDPDWLTLSEKIALHQSRKPLPRFRTKKSKVYAEDPDFSRIIIESVEFVRNDYPSWPSSQHRRIIHDGENLSLPGTAKIVIGRFLRRAWRRPVSEDELGKWVGHFKRIREEENSAIFALRETLTASLASSNFIYLSEPHKAQKPRALNAHELASRLSYFLWSSMPDEKLSALADEGSLLDSKILEKEFDRMLADEKSDRFADQFSTQWFDLDGVDRVAINPRYYEKFDSSLKTDMMGETRAFFREILRSESSALQFIDADFTMLNATLAKHYGLEGPRSQRFERVSLKGTDRPGGVLGHASIQLSGSDGTDSHPIKRAVWIRERLLHDPPNPPPPDVPGIEQSVENFEKLSVREQLAVHRNKVACADCHRSIDPWGIALESYDAIGLFREKTVRKKKPISTETVLPGNHKVNGLEDLKKYLLDQRREQFAHALVSKMLTFALGRSLELSDELVVKELSERFAREDFRLSALMKNIVQSEAFLSR
ncbi:MAG: DUF1592 domain-containing protein [Opitutae bacterium]|nr:DUF1592 domain-containing protein [Opitutae bacterium]